MKVLEFENLDVCKKCGGKCCKRSSCAYAREDFRKIDFNELLKLYNEGKIAFSFVPALDEGDSAGWILMPPMLNTPRVQENIFQGNSQCSFLNAEGCKEDYYHRPRGGRLLIPLDNEDCISLYDAKRALEDWKVFQWLINAVISYIRTSDDKKVYFNHSVCKICEGACCKKSGCNFAPDDFKEITVPFLKEIINRGFISITKYPDIITGLGEDILVLKTRNVNAGIIDDDLLNDSPCILLSSSGCEFADDDRPYGGKALKPNPTGPCIGGYSLRKAAEDWKPYQHILSELREYYKDKEIKYDGIM